MEPLARSCTCILFDHRGHGESDRPTGEFREHGWEKLIAQFETQEPDPIPEWMKNRIRVTDVEQSVNFIESYPDWHWEE